MVKFGYIGGEKNDAYAHTNTNAREQTHNHKHTRTQTLTRPEAHAHSSFSAYLLRMGLEPALGGEHLSANIALKGFVGRLGHLIVMVTHVLLQVGQLSKCPRASVHLAFVRTFS